MLLNRKTAMGLRKIISNSLWNDRIYLGSIGKINNINAENELFAVRDSSDLRKESVDKTQGRGNAIKEEEKRKRSMKIVEKV